MTLYYSHWGCWGFMVFLFLVYPSLWRGTVVPSSVLGPLSSLLLVILAHHFLAQLEVIQPKKIIYLKRKIESTSNSSRFLWLFTNTYLHSWEKVGVGERVGKRQCYYTQKWVALYCLPLVININCHLYYLPVLQSK